MDPEAPDVAPDEDDLLVRLRLNSSPRCDGVVALALEALASVGVAHRSRYDGSVIRFGGR